MSDADTNSGASPECTIYYGPTVRRAAFAASGDWRRISDVAAIVPPHGGAAILIADKAIAQQVVAALRFPSAVMLLAADEGAERVLGPRAHMSVAGFRSRADRQRVLHACCRLACARAVSIRRRRQLGRFNHELYQLNRIGMQLMHEHNVPALLERILGTAKSLTSSDGGALLLADMEEDTPHLVVYGFDFDSLAVMDAVGTRMALDDSTILGHAARTRRPVIIADAYDLPPDVEFVLDRSFDERHKYRRRSLLFLPMIDHVDQLVGVLLLVNKKSDPAARLTDKDAVDRYVVPYSRRDVRLAHSLAGQAAVAIENAQLYARIERTLESIVEAAVSAIDQRDPATAGHSLRVADVAMSMAKAIDGASDGPYRDVHFTGDELRELRFSALLHDVGKLVVPERVLLKAKKLPPVLWERVAARFDLARRTLELEHCGATSENGTLAGALAELEQMRLAVCDANEPSVLDRATDAELSEIASHRVRGADDCEVPYLTDEELHFLELRRGTLDDEERALVEYHVEASFHFLRRIPWTDDLKNIAAYAYGHHEKLDGSGYPRRLHAKDIPLQTRIIGLADMFDALTEADRPYKAALSTTRALEILQNEANAGRVDGALLQVMIASKSYESTATATRSPDSVVPPATRESMSRAQ